MRQYINIQRVYLVSNSYGENKTFQLFCKSQGKYHVPKQLIHDICIRIPIFLFID